MRVFGSQLEQIQLRIDKIQHQLAYSACVDPYDCQKLLELADRLHYPHGKALAHVYLAQYAQAIQAVEEYHSQLDGPGQLPTAKIILT